MRIFHIHFKAEEELQDAFNYYNQNEIGLGYDFIDEIELAFKAIKEAPEQWPIQEKKIRKYIVDRFPYSIFYEITSKFIYILTISHQSRDPNYWKDRID